MTPPEFTWTTDKPTQPGWYWYQPPGMRVRVVEVKMDRQSLYVVHTGMRLEDMPPDEYEWAGPLEAPPR